MRPVETHSLMYEQDVTYPAGSLLRADAPLYKTSSSALLTPLSVTFVPETNSTKEGSRDAPTGKSKPCDESPPASNSLRMCPLYCTRAISPRSVICSSGAHTHHQFSSKASEAARQSPAVLVAKYQNLGNSPAPSWNSQETLFDMSSSLRILPRAPRMLGNSFRPQLPVARKAFSAIAGLRTRQTSHPNRPKEEAEALSTHKSPGTYLGTTKRLPEYNLAHKIVLVSGAGRGLGLVQAEALLEAGATGNSIR